MIDQHYYTIVSLWARTEVRVWHSLTISGQQVTMMSRITLNLKRQAYYGPSPLHSQVDSIIMTTRGHAISAPSGEVVVLSQLRSHSVPSAAHVEFSGRARSGSTSSLTFPVQAITSAEDPSIPITRSRSSKIYFATDVSSAQTPTGGSPVFEHTDRPSASNSDWWNTADIV